MMKLIGLSGTNGSGKDTVGELIAERYNYLFVSVSDLLRIELRKRGLEVTRENLRNLSAEWRREGGLGALVDMAIELFRSSGGEHKGLAIASIRNPGEVTRVHELKGTIVWVDADPRIRYARIQDASRGRGGEDTKTYEEFLAEEVAEMHASGDAATLDMSYVKAHSDVTILNESDLEHLQKATEAALGL